MNFKVIERNDDLKIIKINIKDIDLSIVNSLRRIILSEIPCIAFDFSYDNFDNQDIIVKENNSNFHNEYIQHRISLLPLNYHPKEIDNFDPEKYRFVIDEKNTSTKTVDITTEHIKICDIKLSEIPDKTVHKQIFPKNTITGDYILISKLKPNPYDLDKGDSLNVVCRATRNIGKTHSRWSPVCQAHFYNEIDEDKVNIELEKIQNDKQSVSKFNTLDKFRLFKKNKRGDPSEFTFIIESTTIYRPLDLFKKSIIILRDKIDKYHKDKKIVKPLGPQFWEVIFDDELYGVTLVNVIHRLIYIHQFYESSKKEISYIGYYEHHPQDKKVIMKVRMENESIMIEDFLNKECEYIISYIDKLYIQTESL